MDQLENDRDTIPNRTRFVQERIAAEEAGSEDLLSLFSKTALPENIKEPGRFDGELNNVDEADTMNTFDSLMPTPAVESEVAPPVAEPERKGEGSEDLLSLFYKAALPEHNEEPGMFDGALDNIADDGIRGYSGLKRTAAVEPKIEPLLSEPDPEGKEHWPIPSIRIGNRGFEALLLRHRAEEKAKLNAVQEVDKFSMFDGALDDVSEDDILGPWPTPAVMILDVKETTEKKTETPNNNQGLTR